MPLPPLVHVLDDDPGIRAGLSSLLRSASYAVATYDTPRAFLEREETMAPSCLLLDIRLGEIDGLEFQARLVSDGVPVPVILMTAAGDIPMTVRAMKAGAIDFLPKPIDPENLFSAVETALSTSSSQLLEDARLSDLRARYASLTTREQEVMALVTDGLMNKQAAARLNLSEVTIKIHRGQVMRKMMAKSLAELVRMADQLKGRQRHATGYTPARTVPGDKD